MFRLGRCASSSTITPPPIRILLVIYVCFFALIVLPLLRRYDADAYLGPGTEATRQITGAQSEVSQELAPNAAGILKLAPKPRPIPWPIGPSQAETRQRHDLLSLTQKQTQGEEPDRLRAGPMARWAEPDMQAKARHGRLQPVHPRPTTHPPQQELLLQHGHPDSGPGSPRLRGALALRLRQGGSGPLQPMPAISYGACTWVGREEPTCSEARPWPGSVLGSAGRAQRQNGPDVARGLEVPAQCRSVQHSRRPLTDQQHSRASKHSRGSTEHLPCGLTSEMYPD